MKYNIKVRRAKKEDSRRVWEIRNHPDIRKISNNAEEISYKNHQPWYEKKYFFELDNICFVLEDEKNRVIGYCRFDHDEENNYYITSIAVDSDFQGKGLGSYLLKESLNIIEKKKDIIAQVFKNNIFANKLFIKNNFEIYKEDELNHYFKYII